MKKATILFALLALAALQACQDSEPSAISLHLAIEADLALEHENLRLYPILADAAFLGQRPEMADWLNLPEALENPRFRLTEHKPFGRFADADAVNNLTVQNKTEATVFLMAGEVVQGGNQDRIIAEDAVIAARSIVHIPVFCVEQGRWSPHGGGGGPSASETAPSTHAFTGYYQVASSKVRRATQHSKSQQEVWDEVALITSAHGAQTSTGTYAALEQSDEFRGRRDAYVRFFTGKFDERPAVVGLIAVSGGKVIGADVFAHPGLFQKQYPALLHSYAADAVTSTAGNKMTEEQVQAYARKLLPRAEAALGRDGSAMPAAHFSDM
jgi:hypothetical protein